MIVDAHTHVVSEDRVRYPLGMQGHHAQWVREMPVSAEKMLRLADETGIDRTIVVQSWSAYSFDNSYTVDSARRYPGRLVSVVFIDVAEDGVGERMRYWVKERGAAGVRLLAGLELTDPWPSAVRAHEFWETAADLGVPICLMTRFAQFPEVRRLLGEFPGVPLVLDHLAYPPFEEGPAGESLVPLLGLAAFPNVYLKFSTLSFYGIARGKKSTPQEVFRLLLERFGPGRMMWGSNFPNTFDRGLKEQFHLARESLAFLAEEERRWLFGETALSLWPALRGQAA